MKESTTSDFDLALSIFRMLVCCEAHLHRRPQTHLLLSNPVMVFLAVLAVWYVRASGGSSGSEE